MESDFYNKGYKRILDTVTISRKDITSNVMSKEEANELLLEMTKGMKNIKKCNRDNAFENHKYYMYIGEIPCIHIAIDNKAGTERLFSFYCKEDYLLFNRAKKL